MDYLIGLIFSLFGPFVVIIVIISIIKTIKNQTPPPSDIIRPYTPDNNGARIDRATSKPVNKDKLFIKEARRAGVKNTLIEDNNDDFLARQLREEKEKETYVNEMFDLKRSHSSHCNASGIDTGSAR